VVVKGSENFPFSSCPMFAHYIGNETRLYNFKFIGTFKNTEKILPPSFGHDGEIMSLRFFFSKVYGSPQSYSPFTITENDNKKLFESRLTNYFQNYLISLAEPIFISGLKTIRLEIWLYNNEEQVADKHTVGYYDLSSEKFYHTWQRN
jgi:hypothetical protein